MMNRGGRGGGNADAPGGAPVPGRGGGRTANAGAGGSYFTDTRKKGEVNELKNLLREVTVERESKRKREIIKKVIAYMTLGIDVSRLFSEMVLCVDTKDIILKKMVYLYLTNCAAKNSELAIMCINTLLNDCRNEDPMVRGLALRSLCSLRLDSILEYIHDPLQNSLTDASAYVRKTGVMGILKVYSLNPDLIKDSELIDTLYNMIRDRDPQVVSNCLMALSEIMSDEGGMAVNQQIISHLLGRISEFNEWGQCNVLSIVSSYTPQSDEETFQIMNILEQCLRVSNSAVILAAAKCFFHLTDSMDPSIQMQVLSRLKQPLLTLLAGGSHELNHCVLAHINLMVTRQPSVFSAEYRQFYARYNEPTHVKYIKIEIMASVAQGQNISDLVTELSEYVTDVDTVMSKKAIHAIAKVAMNNPDAAADILDRMVDFLEMDMANVRAQTMIVMKDLLRKYPEYRTEVLYALPKLILNVDSEQQENEAKCAVIYLIGEFGEDVSSGPYLLEPLIDSFADQSTAAQLELLTASMKLFFKRPPEMQSMLGRLLNAALSTNESNQDVHDRSLLYYRLLETCGGEAAAIILQDSVTTQQFTELSETEFKDKIFYEFNSLAVIYGKPSETFISHEKLKATQCSLDIGDEQDDADDEEASDMRHEGSLPHDYDDQQPQEYSHHDNNVGGGIDLLDMNFDAPANPTNHHQDHQQPHQQLNLNPNPCLEAMVFQSKWGNLPQNSNGNVTFQLSSIPSTLGDVESVFLNQGQLHTVASGDVGSQFKFFFYAQDLSSQSFFLSEVVLDKSSQVLSATIKLENQQLLPPFLQHVEQLLQPFF